MVYVSESGHAIEQLLRAPAEVRGLAVGRGGCAAGLHVFALPLWQGGASTDANWVVRAVGGNVLYSACSGLGGGRACLARVVGLWVMLCRVLLTDVGPPSSGWRASDAAHAPAPTVSPQLQQVQESPKDAAAAAASGPLLAPAAPPVAARDAAPPPLPPSSAAMAVAAAVAAAADGWAAAVELAPGSTDTSRWGRGRLIRVSSCLRRGVQACASYERN